MTSPPLHGRGAPRPQPRMSLVLPAYNEGAVLAPVLSALTGSFPDAELILVSDGSTDNTPAVAASFAPSVRCIHYHPNRGKGYAIRQGMLAATGEVLVFTDADLPFGVEGIEQVIAALAQQPGADVAIAAKTRIRRGVLYRCARGVARLGIRMLTGLDYPDTQAGLKAFRRRAAHGIYARTHVNGFASDIEVLFMARHYSLQVVSVPLPVTNAFDRPSSFGLGQGVRLLRDVGRIRLGVN